MFNFVLFAAILTLVIYASNKHEQLAPGWALLLFPIIGMLSGHWLRKGKYGWARISVMVVSFIGFVVFLFNFFVAGPQLDKLKAAKFAKTQEKPEVTIDKNTERLFLGVYAGDLKIVEEQLDLGVDVNAINETKQTPLHVTQNATIAKLLIDKGADINILDDLGSSPIFNKEVEIAAMLLDAGVDINAVNENGNTLLIRYTYAGYLDGIKFLLARGASAGVCNKDNNNAMDIAAHFHPNSATMEYLQTLKIPKCLQ